MLLVSINYLIQTTGLRHLDSLHSFACCCPFNANVSSFTGSWGFLLWGKNKQAKEDVWEDIICSCTSTEKHRSRFPPGTPDTLRDLLLFEESCWPLWWPVQCGAPFPGHRSVQQNVPLPARRHALRCLFPRNPAATRARPGVRLPVRNGAAGAPGWSRGSTTLCPPKGRSCARLPGFVPGPASPARVRQHLPGGNPPRFPRARPFRGRRPGSEGGRAGRCCAALGSRQPRGSAARPAWSRPERPTPSSRAGRRRAERCRQGSMSHGAQVIRTGVSSGGPAAPPAAPAAAAGSDAELVDGAYFRSCAGLLKVAQMVRGGGRPRGARASPRAASCGDGCGEPGRGCRGPSSRTFGLLRFYSSALVARGRKTKSQFLRQSEALRSVRRRRRLFPRQQCALRVRRAFAPRG